MRSSPLHPLLWSCAIVVVLAARAAWADPTEELERLRQEAAQMRKSLDSLDERIRTLERENPDRRQPAVTPSRVDAAASPPPDAAKLHSEFPTLAALKQNWSRVVAGTPQAEVETLLGKPDTTLRIDGSLVWYYTYSGVGKGSVFFDGGGKVTAAQSPRFGWSW
jgi:hypothetical protein